MTDRISFLLSLILLTIGMLTLLALLTVCLTARYEKRLGGWRGWGLDLFALDQTNSLIHF